jgi:hypothetical protein
MRIPHLSIETVTTRDQVLEHSDGSWSSIPRCPPGPGWVIADASRDRHTRWRRLHLDCAGARRQVSSQEARR